MRIPSQPRIWLVTICCVGMLLTSQEDKHLAVYTPQKAFTVNVAERGGREYVPLLDLLQPLGEVSLKIDGDKWKVRFGGDESQFQAGKSKAKIRGKNLEVGAPVLVEDGVVYVPLRGLGQMLPRLLNSTVDFREAARRLVVAGAEVTFSAEFQANPSRLVLHFSKPVNPTIAAEPGRVRMTFSKDAVVSGAATQNFGDKLISSASFDERNGAGELIVAASAPLLASFSDENRTITLGAAPQAAAAAQPRPAPPVAPPPQAPAVASTPAKPIVPSAPAPARNRYLVVIDPAHGGQDRGAQLAAGVEEKEITLAFGRRLRSALERAGITSVLLRDGDTDLSADQRAIAANTARAAIFISVHAGNVGRGLRMYTARVGDTTLKQGAVLPWDSAQASFLEESRALAGSIAAELSKHAIEHGEARAQLRPLNHVTGAALAIEVLPGKEGISSLTSTQYQQNLCGAIADAVVASRRSLEARK